MRGRRSIGGPPHGWRSIAPKMGILKNVVVLGCSSLCAYGASFIPLRTYVAISRDLELLGPFAISLLYALAAVSTLYASIVTRRSTYRACIALCQLPFGLFLASVAYNHYYTLIPAIVLVGLSQGPLWIATIDYLVNMSAQYAYFSYNSQEVIVPYFLGVFNALVSVGAFTGHLLTAGAFHAVENATSASDASAELEARERAGPRGGCGGEYCVPPGMSFPTFPPSSNLSFLSFPQLSNVVPVYFVTVSAAVVLALFPLGKLTVQLCTQTQESTTSVQLFSDAIQIFQDRKMQMLMPALVLRSLLEAFLYCDVIKAFVRCIARESRVGYVLLCAGCVSAFLHAFLSSVLRHINRMTVLSAAIAIQGGAVVVMWMWVPVADDQPILYVIATSWEMGNTIWKTISQTMVFQQFPERWEAPFVAYFFCTCLGLSIGFGVCPYGCFRHKLVVYVIGFVLAAIPFVYLELKGNAPTIKKLKKRNSLPKSARNSAKRPKRTSFLVNGGQLPRVQLRLCADSSF